MNLKLIFFTILLYLNINYLISFAINLKSLKSNTCLNIEDFERQDCFPQNNSNQNECLKRSCCWNKPKNTSYDGIPYCYYPLDYSGYSLTSEAIKKNYIYLTLLRNLSSSFPLDFKKVFIEIISLNKYSLRIQINTKLKKRYKVPIDLNLNTDENLKDKDKLYYIKKDFSNIYVYRKSTNKIIWSANYNTLIFSEQFLQISTNINSKHLFGLAEHKDDYEKTIKNYRKLIFFNKDEAPTENLPLYGSHPVYLSYEHELSNNSNIKTLAHNVFLLNSNAIELQMNPKPSLTWRTLGGILDFYINLGPTPEQAVSQYISLVGKPPLPPVWGLGFHLCRFGYNSLNNTKLVNSRTLKAKIPFDVQWNDIDFMNQRNLFTIDEKNFAGLNKFIKYLHSINMKYIPIFDPGLGTGFSKKEYPPYYEGLKNDVYIKHENNLPLEAKVWNKYYTSFVDFTKKSGKKFWIDQMKKMHNKIEFDGSWNDMNEIAVNYEPKGSKIGCNWNSSLENPYYVPNELNQLTDRTICMGSKLKKGLYYNLHNLYAYFEVKTVNKALRLLKKRPFIISRATFPGIGKYGSHWSGDTFSTWDNLQYSIANMLEFNILGIPLVGSDICGFNGNTTEELCARWHSVGAFYPFSRNHNSINTIDQDPVALGLNVINAAKYALKIRYSLISVLYTEFYFASQFGLPVARSLSFVFPDDENSYKIKNQFLWGNSIMIIPIVTENTQMINAYFPCGKWYNYMNGTLLSNSTTGTFKLVFLPIDSILISVRGGYILPTHSPAVTTKETRSSSFILIVALDEYEKAFGSLYYDDGESYDIVKTKNYTFIEFMATENSITSKVVYMKYDILPLLTKIRIHGLKRLINNVYESGKPVNFTVDLDITVYDLKINLFNNLNLTWTFK